MSEILKYYQWANLPSPKAGRNFFGDLTRDAKPRAEPKAPNAGLGATVARRLSGLAAQRLLRNIRREANVRAGRQKPFCAQNPGFWTF
ncbi:hypothetical protein V1289_000478 [Bradyrhizobium sp. AZCC 2289]